MSEEILKSWIDHLIEDMNDRDLMLLLGQVRSGIKSIDEFTDKTFDLLDNDRSRTIVISDLATVHEELTEVEERFDMILAKLGYTIDDFGYYPILYRGKVKSCQWINLSNIECKSLPINEAGFMTAQLVRGRVAVPPITVKDLGNGNYRVDDGRHRFLAFKLNGLEKIPAYVHGGNRWKVKEAIEVTGKKFAKTFKKLA